MPSFILIPKDDGIGDDRSDDEMDDGGIVEDVDDCEEDDDDDEDAAVGLSESAEAKTGEEISVSSDCVGDEGVFEGRR